MNYLSGHVTLEAVDWKYKPSNEALFIQVNMDNILITESYTGMAKSSPNEDGDTRTVSIVDGTKILMVGNTYIMVKDNIGTTLEKIGREKKYREVYKAVLTNGFANVLPDKEVESIMTTAETKEVSV